MNDVPERWRLKDFAPGERESLRAFSDDYDTAGWIDVSVPGDVHQALIAAGRIPDPYCDRNALECAWMESREWWYRTSLAGAGPPGIGLPTTSDGMRIPEAIVQSH